MKKFAYLIIPLFVLVLSYGCAQSPVANSTSTLAPVVKHTSFLGVSLDMTTSEVNAIWGSPVSNIGGMYYYYSSNKKVMLIGEKVKEITATSNAYSIEGITYGDSYWDKVYPILGTESSRVYINADYYYLNFDDRNIIIYIGHGKVYEYGIFKKVT